jgi:uncharacterized repeat protein (TIGR01451 family)
MTGCPDVAITQSVSFSPLIVGQNSTYSLKVQNVGPTDLDASQTITVIDTLPVGLTLVAFRHQ